MENALKVLPTDDSPPRRARLTTTILLFAMAGIGLFAHLGALPLHNAEGRWGMISRHMYRTGQLFTPSIGPNVYWDKPLLSYWQILPFAAVAGDVTESAARLPSAIWAVALLAMTFDIARRWFDRTTALAAAGVLASSFGFLEWGRNAMVEMSNTGVTMLAVWIFLVRRSDGRHAWIFWLAVVCGIGANLKGLPAYGVPTVVILAHSLARRDWKWMPPWPVLLAAGALSLLVFLAVPAAASFASRSVEPFQLVWRENVVRFFAPFDHKDPFYAYALRIFDIGAPWAVLLPLSLIRCFSDSRYRKSRAADALIVAGAILLFFALSGSRRRYYILPVLPFVALVVGDLLAGFQRTELPRWTSHAVLIVTTALGMLAICVLPAYFAVPVFLRQPPPNLSELAPAAVLLSACGLCMLLSSIRKNIVGVLLSAVAATCVYSVLLDPWLAGQPNAASVRESARRLRDMNLPVAFLYSDSSDTAFYLDREFAVLDSEENAEDWAGRTHGLVVVVHGQLEQPWECALAGPDWNGYIFRK
jgi:4-amino-4-deoxy-L-arabinose transferase-like glycosyltransferase